VNRSALSLRGLRRRAAIGLAAAATLAAVLPAQALPARAAPAGTTAGRTITARTTSGSQQRVARADAWMPARAFRGMLPGHRRGHRPSDFARRAPATVASHAKRPTGDNAFIAPAPRAGWGTRASARCPASVMNVRRVVVSLAARAPPAGQ
jgi:hypothetical protein